MTSAADPLRLSRRPHHRLQHVAAAVPFARLATLLMLLCSLELRRHVGVRAAKGADQSIPTPSGSFVDSTPHPLPSVGTLDSRRVSSVLGFVVPALSPESLMIFRARRRPCGRCLHPVICNFQVPLILAYAAKRWDHPAAHPRLEARGLFSTSSSPAVNPGRMSQWLCREASPKPVVMALRYRAPIKRSQIGVWPGIFLVRPAVETPN